MIKRLAFEDRSSGRLKQTIVDSPNAIAIANAIDTLDGSNNTMVVLQTGDNETLTIGGGNDGLCVVDFSSESQQFLTLRRNETSRAEREIVSGGQLAPFEETFLIQVNVVSGIVSNWTSGKPVAPDDYRWVSSREVR